jgi:hypothetical protein
MERCLIASIIVLAGWLGVAQMLNSEQDFQLREKMASFFRSSPANSDSLSNP